MRCLLYFLLAASFCLAQGLLDLSVLPVFSLWRSPSSGVNLSRAPNPGLALGHRLNHSETNSNVTAGLYLLLEKGERRDDAVASRENMIYKIMSREYVQLLPHRTRTFVRQESSLVLARDPPRAATKVYGYNPCEVRLSATLAYWVVNAVFATFCTWSLLAVGTVTSASKRLEGGLHNSVSLDDRSRPLWVIQGLLKAVLRLFMFLDSVLGTLNFLSSRLVAFLCIPLSLCRLALEIRRTQEDQRRRLDCLKRKADRPKPHSEVQNSLVAEFLFKTHKIGQDCENIGCVELSNGTVSYDPKDFDFVKQVAEGGFGTILQVEHKVTGRMLALKKLVEADNPSEAVKGEVLAIAKTQNLIHDLHGDWYPRLFGAFKDDNAFYLLMSFYERGDLLGALKREGCFHRTVAKFYLAEILLGIQGLHHLGIIHRDLKPDNILFTSCGHLVIADFGIAHLFQEDEDTAFMEDEFPLWDQKKTLGGDEFPLLTPSIDNPHILYGSCGTPNYSAPEVRHDRGYSYGADYYSMGILFHEMLTGSLPLAYQVVDPDPMCDPEILLDLERKDYHLQRLSSIENAFLENILQEDTFSRLSVKDMKAHPVFAGLDWLKLAQRGIPPPQPPVLRKVTWLSMASEGSPA